MGDGGGVRIFEFVATEASRLLRETSFTSVLEVAVVVIEAVVVAVEAVVVSNWEVVCCD